MPDLPTDLIAIDSGQHQIQENQIQAETDANSFSACSPSSTIFVS